MTIKRASNAKQTTQTSGTGTLTLIANAGETKSLQTVLGTGPAKCRCMLRGQGYFEHFRGTFTAPSTLTRDEVIESSNSGSLVNIPAGTSDVYLLDYAQFVLDKFSTSSRTLANADISSSIIYTGSSACTLNLPASASTLPDFWVFLRNDGSGLITLTPNGSDTIDGSALLGNGGCGFLYLDGTVWKFCQTGSDRGSWTPTFTGLTNVGTLTVTGNWQKIGKIVFYQITASATTSVALSSASVTNFPFSGALGYSPCVVASDDGTKTGIGTGAGNGNTIFLVNIAATAKINISGQILL